MEGFQGGFQRSKVFRRRCRRSLLPQAEALTTPPSSPPYTHFLTACTSAMMQPALPSGSFRKGTPARWKAATAAKRTVSCSWLEMRSTTTCEGDGL